jgi:hypothetical protein
MPTCFLGRTHVLLLHTHFDQTLLNAVWRGAVAVCWMQC